MFTRGIRRSFSHYFSIRACRVNNKSRCVNINTLYVAETDHCVIIKFVVDLIVSVTTLKQKSSSARPYIIELFF